MTDAAKSGAAQASTMAHTAKIKAEISLLESKISGLKRDWGETCFDAYQRGDHGAVQREHLKARNSIDVESAKLDAKRRELDAAKAPAAGPVTVASMPIATPVTATQTMAITVPANASPGQQIAVVLPSGQQLQAIVPPNAAPGSVFHIQV